MKQICRVLLKDWILLVFVSCDTNAPRCLSTNQHHHWVLSLFPEVWQSASQHDDWVFPLFSEMQQKHMKQTSSIKSQRVLFPSPFRFSARLHSLFMHCLNELANQSAYCATLSANCFLFLWKQPRAQKILCTCGFVIESNSVSFYRFQMQGFRWLFRSVLGLNSDFHLQELEYKEELLTQIWSQILWWCSFIERVSA